MKQLMGNVIVYVGCFIVSVIIALVIFVPLALIAGMKANELFTDLILRNNIW